MIYKFTTRAKKALDIAKVESTSLGNSYIGTEHILYGLAKEGIGVASKVLEKENINDEDIETQIIDIIGKSEEIDKILGYTPKSKKTIENSFIEAKRLGYDYIGTEHLLIGLLKEENSMAVRILTNLGMEIPKLYNQIIKTINETNIFLEKKDDTKNKTTNINKETPTLNQFGENLNIKVSLRKY